MKNLIYFGLPLIITLFFSSIAFAGNPHVSFSRPYHGQHFPAGTDLYVKVNASDSDGIKYVKLSVNGSYVDTENHHPYEWGKPHKTSHHKLNNMQHGTYRLKAVAYDNHGNKGEKTITIYIDRSSHNNAPSVSFSKPYNGQRFPAGTDLYVKVNASDHDDYVYDVKLYVNGHYVRRESSHPYEWGKPHSHNDHLLNNMQPGTYYLKAVAQDNYGKETTKTITIYVDQTNRAPSLAFDHPRHNYYYDEGFDANVRVTATDHDDYVDYVKLYLNDSYIGRDDHAPYQWSHYSALQNLSAGTYTLKAVAYDNYGKRTERKIVFHVKHNNQAPVVSFDKPYNGQKFTVGDDVFVRAVATDHDDYVDYVKLYINGNYVGRDSHAPYEWRNTDLLKNLSVGTYTLKAVAYDNHGKSKERSIKIHVEAPSCNASAWFSAPANNAIFWEGDDVVVEFDATNAQDIEKIDLILNGTWVGEDRYAPYKWSNTSELKNMWAGDYELKAIVTDKCGDKTVKYRYFKVEKGDNGNNCESIQNDDFDDYESDTNISDYDGWININNSLSGKVVNSNGWGNMLKIDNTIGESTSLWEIDQDLNQDSYIIAWDVHVPEDKYAICTILNNDRLQGIAYKGTNQDYENSSWVHFECIIDNGTATFTNGVYIKTFDLDGGIPSFMVFQTFLDGGDKEVEFYIDNVEILPLTCGEYENFGGGIEGRNTNNISSIDYKTQNFSIAKETSATQNINLNIYPNPMIERATINFELQQTQVATIEIVDATGRSVYQVTDQFDAGRNTVEFVNTNNLPAGMYFIKIQTADQIKTLSLQIAQ